MPCSWCQPARVSSWVTTGSFLRVSSWMSKTWASLRLPTRLVTRIGLPVVSCPYIAAAEIPMPCWPRELWQAIAPSPATKFSQPGTERSYTKEWAPPIGRTSSTRNKHRSEAENERTAATSRRRCSIFGVAT